MLPLDVETALAVAASFDASSRRLPTRLDGIDADWAATVRELERLGIIPYGGELVFQADQAILSGSGATFRFMAPDRPQRDVILGGWLTFTPGSATETEDCRLGVRVTQHDGPPGVFPRCRDHQPGCRVHLRLHPGRGDSLPQRERLQPPAGRAAPRPADRARPDRQLYVDGQLMFEDVPVEARSGVYGFGLTAASPAASCLGQTLWAYAVPVVTPGVCEASAARPINQRSGPGVGYAPLGKLTRGWSSAWSARRPMRPATSGGCWGMAPGCGKT
jgi:hypothetical protein